MPTISIRLFVCGFAVAFSTVGCGVSTLTTAPSEVSVKVDELFAAIEAGTFAESYETGTTPEFRKVTSEPTYRKIGDVVKSRLGPLKSKKTSGINVRVMNGVTSVDANYQAEFANGSGTITVRMKKVGDAWKILLLRVDSPIFQQDMATQTCSACGGAYAATAKFCPGCGRKLDETDSPEKPGDK